MSKKKKRRGRLEKEKKARKKARHEGRSHPVELVEEAVLASYDEGLLEKARTRWQFGDWDRLTQIEQKELIHHPQREKIALLVASAHFQRGDNDAATRYLRLAQDWGCSRRLIAQMLVSGAHNSLAYAQIMLNRHEKAKRHFFASIKTGGVLGAPELLTEVRYRASV